MIIKHNVILNHLLVKSFLTAFEYSLSSLVITDANDSADGEQFLYANQAFVNQTGYSFDELKGKSPRMLQGPKTDKALLKALNTSIYGGDTFVGQTINYRKDGSEYIARWSITPIKDDNGHILAFVSNQIEVSNQFLNLNTAKILAEALNQTADAVLVTDLLGYVIYSNASFYKLTGYTPDELLGKHTRIFKSGKMEPESYRQLWLSLIENKSFEGLFTNKHKDGTDYFEYKTITPILDEHQRPMYYLAISRDATQATQAMDKLSYLAHHDELTGLYNRAKFNLILTQKRAAFQQAGHAFSLILGDIDDFKKINDIYGHDTGDKVLKSVADKLTNSVRHDDFVARWGGEEFVILVDNDLDAAMKVAQTLVRNMATTDTSGAIAEPVSLSFGVATYTENMTLEHLFEQADQALYRAKADGKNCARSLITR